MKKPRNKILEGAKEALEIAKGRKMPSKITAYGWLMWHPLMGFDHFIYSKRPRNTYGKGWKPVRVKVTSIAKSIG